MGNKLSFGYLYDFRNPKPWQRSYTDVYHDVLDFIEWTEQVGFYGAWVPEHHCADDGYMPSPLTILGSVAARTKKLKIGTGVGLGPLYHPVRFAEDCAVVQNLSGGRLEIGLAIGYRRREAEALSAEFSRRGKRFDEFLNVVTQLWLGEVVSVDGDFFSIQNASLSPLPEHHIPLYLGGFADKALERVAKFGDGYFGNEDVCENYLNKLAKYGKDSSQARIRIQGLFFVVADNPDEAMEELAPYYHYVNNCYGEWLNEDKASGVDNTKLLKAQSLDEFIASGVLQIKTPTQAIEYFQNMLTRTPVEHFIMMLPPGIPTKTFKKYAQTFAEKVMPAFK
ncbi:LLM class flavin-dependent oxidoreductase [Halioxenophilus aromaticivorans]|uniref:Luciferase-like domain-containing protein n=1 Tax=Halioxenophilus aromaticivorans TaxID=1306992 RepID=A0AAV3TW22_9ALTE